MTPREFGEKVASMMPPQPVGLSRPSTMASAAKSLSRAGRPAGKTAPPVPRLGSPTAFGAAAAK